MAAKPLVIPELFAGDKSWDDWIDHFESVSEVCGWDEANKLKWLRYASVEGLARYLSDCQMTQKQIMA